KSEGCLSPACDMTTNVNNPKTRRKRYRMLPGDETWAGLKSAGLASRFEPGEPLFREGDDAEGAYVLLSGRCAVSEGGKQVNVIEPGELFGEIAGFGGGKRTATVTALVPCEVLILSADQLQRGFTDSPDLLKKTLQVLASRARRIADRQVAYREEHKALQEVQRSLLPDLAAIDSHGRFQVEALWQPCTYASGDYYDVIQIGPERFLFAVGDVMGHGAESSLMMAIARGQIREMARHFRRTDELLLNLDGYLRDNAPSGQGMSLVVGALDTRTLVLEHSTAGHPPPLLLREGTVTELDTRPGILLALPILLGVGYERLEIQMQPGDRLFFYTDGFYEINHPEQAGKGLLGDGELARLFGEAVEQNPDNFLRALLQRLLELEEPLEPKDDRTALLLTLL
ncbi:MAG: serine phosphatase RsbU, regulator of sigma subunit, partial [Deltaproteobacteria bacterium]|nr:serine phosphatase RsbU, regulator of sigma subunit [Deltaproteobacteria bacterium]